MFKIEKEVYMVYKSRPLEIFFAVLCSVLLAIIGACSSTYYGAMEKMGIHKRDILIDRVVGARDAQTEAQEQFKSALEQFSAIVHIEDTDLKRAYEQFNAEYEASEEAAQTVSERIEKVESVSEALFDEWQEELSLYKSADLRRASKQKLQETKRRYKEMLASMHRAEKSMEPVLSSFRDNVLFLKHNLNAQAIGSLKGEFFSLQGEINDLLKNMNDAIMSSNQFIADIKQ